MLRVDVKTFFTKTIKKRVLMNSKKLEKYNWICDCFFLLGMFLVLFPHFGKSRVPSILYPFFCYDTMIAVYPFAIFSILVIIWLFLKKEYKKIVFVVVACGIYCLGNLIITWNGLAKIIGNVTDYDLSMLDGSRLGFFNIVTKIFSNVAVSTRLFMSEGLFAVYSGFTQYKDVFLVAFLIGFFYVDRVDTLKRLFFGGLIATFALVSVFEIIEIPFLFNNEKSIEILKKINPFFYDVYSDGGWWPPIIWQDYVLRSVFAEPSFFGYYLGFTTVAFIHLLLNYKNKIVWAVLLFLSYWFSFLTNSRSGIMLVLGGTVVYCLLFLIKEKRIKGVLIVLLVLALAFVGNDIVERIKVEHGTSTATVIKEEENTVISPLDGNVFEVVKASFEPGDGIKSSISESSIIKTIKTVFSMDARSNVTRYGYTLAALNVGLENPILGVGQSYLGPYISEELINSDRSNGELGRWIKDQEEAGILNNIYSSFNQYTTLFALGGVLGLLLDLFVFGFIVIYYVYFAIKMGIKNIKPYSIMVFSLLAVIAAWGFSGHFTSSYLYVITLGIGLSDVITCHRLLKHSKTNV